MIIPQNYSSSIFEILSNIDPLQIILLKLIDREEESRLWQDLRNVYLQTSALSYRNNVAISPSMLSNSRQHQPQFFSPDVNRSTTDAIYDDIITIRAALANLLIFIFQCCSTTKHTPRIYIQIRRGREFIGSLWQKMRAVAFKPVIGIVRQWQPDCYHTPFSLQPNICATCFRKLHSRFISPPLHFFIALDYRIYSIDRKLFWDRSVYQQRKQPRNFLIQSGNTGFLENTIQSS